MPSEDDEHPAAEMSKRKQRKANRLSVAELKRLVKKPEVVDWVDVSANDPKLLIEIKSHRNTIPIPQHWSQKRDYLQGKRGIEKPAFQLPSQSKSASCPPGDYHSQNPVSISYRLHCRHRHRYAARCSQREGGFAVAQAEDPRTRSAKDGQDRHRLSETS